MAAVCRREWALAIYQGGVTLEREEVQRSDRYVRVV
jgi:hypothetical protein